MFLFFRELIEQWDGLILYVIYNCTVVLFNKAGIIFTVGTVDAGKIIIPVGNYLFNDVIDLIIVNFGMEMLVYKAF